jgi:glycosyltransferase involved in cell wall biosynthesis
MFFTGYVNHAEMPSLLKLAKVGINYMAPTQANQCRASIKVREYLAAGLNVVCNPVGDTEVFGDHVTFCFTLKDYPGAIRKALELKTQERISSAQAFLEASYSWPNLIEDFLAHVMG